MAAREESMWAAYVHLPDDAQGPHVLLCGACIVADDGHVEERIDGTDWRCACCGSTATYDACAD